MERIQDADIVSNDLHSSSFVENESNLCQPSTSTATKVVNNEVVADVSPLTNGIETRFTQLTSDERKSLLSQRKEEMFQKARMKYMQNL